jgi:hypothetical protein
MVDTTMTEIEFQTWDFDLRIAVANSCVCHVSTMSAKERPDSRCHRDARGNPRSERQLPPLAPFLTPYRVRKRVIVAGRELGSIDNWQRLPLGIALENAAAVLPFRPRLRIL